MIFRQEYINKIKPYINIKLVKILSGIRRSGKSTILEMIRQELLSKGVDESHIIFRKYTNEEYDSSFTSKMMYDELKSSILDDKKYYFFLDELQEVIGWEKVVNNLLENHNSDIYVTGSNSKLMSSEISTYLTGRYVSIPIYTLSFGEYLLFRNNINKSNKEHLQDYIKLGGFPLIASINVDADTTYSIVEDIYNSVVVNDITNKHQITNIDLFNRVIKFVIENVGKTFSGNSIVNFLKSENRSISIETIYNYLEWLEKAFVIYRCKRYDLQGKKILKTQEKFYLADQSIKYALYGFNPTSIASMIENLVYLELKRRDYNVYIGKYYDKEIDFVATKRDEKIYVQVCRELPKESDREIKNLLDIKDHYPKFIVTLDDYAGGNIDGVKIIHLVDFLLNK
ncbi:MAG: ATP-binding protein [Erysipelotrichaceae bacterium]|nr:ATP-binding protein [Erysipelotrichaceae bacterium]